MAPSQKTMCVFHVRGDKKWLRCSFVVIGVSISDDASVKCVTKVGLNERGCGVIKVGIVGGTGYTGVELLRLLATHPGVDVQVVTSRAEKGLRVDSVYPSLRGFNHLCFVEPVIGNLLTCDVVFFATPNATAMHMAKELLALK